MLSTVRGGLVPANRLSMLVHQLQQIIHVCPYLSLSSWLAARQVCSVAAGFVSAAAVVAVAAVAVSAAAAAPSGHS